MNSAVHCLSLRLLQLKQEQKKKYINYIDTSRQQFEETTKPHVLKHTQICSLIRLLLRKTVLTLKSMPTVLTKAEVKESSA